MSLLHRGCGCNGEYNRHSFFLQSVETLWVKRLNANNNNNKSKSIIINYGEFYKKDQGHLIYIEECSGKVSIKCY